MSYRFQPDPTVKVNVQRIVTEQLHKAKTHLTDPPDDNIHKGIHEARKCLKRIRGLLRMIRIKLGEEFYKEKNVRFRDAGRLLSPIRDAQAMIECFDEVASVYELRIDFSRMQPLRAVLVSELEELSQEKKEIEKNVREVIDVLDGSFDKIDHWPLAGTTSKDLAKGVRKVYKRARKRDRQIHKVHHPGRMHEWRKRVKYLRYHFKLFKGLDKSWAKDRYKGYKKLSKLQGSHHDLEVMRQKLNGMETTPLDPVAEAEFRILLRQRQDHLYQKTLKYQEKLFKKKPKKMRKRVQQQLESLGFGD